YLHLSPELRAAFLQPGSQDFCTASRAHVQQPGRTCPGDQGCEVHQDPHKRRRLARAAGVLPHMLVDPEDAYAVQVGGVVVDKLAAGVDGNLVDQLPAHPECFRRGGHTHAVDCQALEDPAGDPVGQLRTIIGTRQGGLADLPVTGGIRAGETGDAHVQTGGEPYDGQVHQPAENVVTLGAGPGAFRTGVADGHRCGIDDGEVSGIGGTGDRQSDLRGTADGVGDKVASKLHSTVLVRSDGSFATLI